AGQQIGRLDDADDDPHRQDCQREKSGDAPSPAFQIVADHRCLRLIARAYWRIASFQIIDSADGYSLMMLSSFESSQRRWIAFTSLSDTAIGTSVYSFSQSLKKDGSILVSLLSAPATSSTWARV